jgi:glycosyltransferase involved in cell wall biosynthesis
MGVSGRRRVEELFSWRAVAQRVAQVYDETIRDFEAEQMHKEKARADR